MRITDIIEALRIKLSVSAGRHLYGVLGSYRQLKDFVHHLFQAKDPDNRKFPKPLSVNQCILNEINDEEFRQLVINEAKRPEPTAAHVAKAFDSFLRAKLKKRGLLVLWHMEMLFAYHLELNILRTMATDDDWILLLLPGKRSSGKIIMFPEDEKGSYMLPSNLIADNHLWEISDGGNL